MNDVPFDKPDVGEVVLAARSIAKSYGSTKALKGVNFDIHRGKVTTLFGENGAGKSTLMKILSGVEKPTSGEIVLDGKPIVFSSSTDARNNGISIIHQELSLAPNLSVRDNIFMGRELTGPTGVDFAEEERQVRKLLKELEEEIDPLTPVEELRLGQQQIVEIARALSVNSRILIMDEPTSALSASEVEVLFKVVRDLTAKGVSIVYISHHLEEALQITDHAVVLRDGAMTAYAPRTDIDLEWIVRNMVGENFDLGSPPTGYEKGAVALRIENLSVPSPSGGYSVVDRLSLDVRAGEIVCIYGLMGAGRTETMECVAGRLRASGGRVLLHGSDVSRLSIAERIAAGLVLVPEDRQRDGLVQTMTVGQNLSLASIGAFTKGLFTSRRREISLVDQSIKNVHIKTDGGAAKIGSLSGGNQQKVVIGKMLATSPSVVLLDEPSRGIDIGAKSEVFKLLAEGARRGLAVIYSTSEVGECLSVAHRIIVMAKGKISAEFGPDVTKEKIMAASGEVDLEHQIADAYGLDMCKVVTDLHQDELPLKALGLAGGAFLSDQIKQHPNMVIGVSHGRTLQAIVDNVAVETAPDLRVVALMGGLTQKFSTNPHEVVTRLAERTGAQAMIMPVPFMANSAEDREVLANQKGVADAYDLAKTCDLMLIGVGTTGTEAELVITGMVEPAEMAAIASSGGVGEMLGHFFDDEGQAVANELTRRIVTQTYNNLRNRRIVAVAGGRMKVAAIRAVLASRLLSGLITDERTARSIMETGREQPGHASKPARGMEASP
ncbi:sugar-binding domain-containing protein [Mesorhizobium sp. VK23B]|uniref:Sugar-binding domain-containing protein n=1 Tax=Mesorhizobium dulcispinae TaxID=3072316 RepID=A0ABU4XA59_9HYPH|nr:MULTISPECIES: sugar-binding domain-containing protein [unclassified Mesorhizobium]MDX8464650.1 sugar-binding domain-containing protein [Mesorhizobium sp. VK23B]MDX8471036.1 sugar-binding domain-containing protein [Mesorhizobium sp. VK23A]